MRQRDMSLTSVRSCMLTGLMMLAGMVRGGENTGLMKHLPPADPATLPEVPAIRPGNAHDLVLDGRLDEAAWKTTPGYSEFGLDSGEGPTDFPTTARFLYADRVLWIGLECDLPRPSDGGAVAAVLDAELIEIFLDNAGGRRMSYHLGLKPSGSVSIPGVKPSDVPGACQCVVTRRELGYTLEIKLQLDAFDQLGIPNKERIGINIARDSVKRWASLIGGTGQGQKPEQFWTLLLGGGGIEKAPAPAYRPLFRESEDLVGLATNFLSGCDALKGLDYPGRPLMEVRMRRLAGTVTNSIRDRWGAKVPLRAALYRGWRARKGLLPHTATAPECRAIEEALLSGAADAFPESEPVRGGGWRECAFRSGDDGLAQPYALYVPDGVSTGKPLALVVYLHGSGMGSFSDGLIFERYSLPADFMIARVNARRCKMYRDAEKREIDEVIADIGLHWPLDADRVSLLGFSAGAFAAADLSVERPGKYSAIAAVAGRFRKLGPGRAPSLPVVAVWGLADTVVPYDPNEAGLLREMVSGNGYEIQIFALPCTDHAVPMSGLEFWLARQRRGVPKGEVQDVH